MEKKLELVGTVEFGDGSVVKILRQYDPVSGFEYFLEENGKLQCFDAFGEREYEFRMPYPVMLDRWMDGDVWPTVRSVDLNVYHIEDDDWEAEVGGQKLKVWFEKALHYYESDEVGFWKEYWGLVKGERKIFFYFFEGFFQKEENRPKNGFYRKIFNISLGEYRDKLVEHFISQLSRVLERGLKKPKNEAKGLLVWLEENNARRWEPDIVAVMGTVLFDLYEWEYLTAEERHHMVLAIYERLLELAKKEEEWAGLSVEGWLGLLKKKLVEEKVIKDTDAAFWKWLKHYIWRKNLQNLFIWAFKGNLDWDWMPRGERRKLAEFPSVWTNIHTYRPFKATRRGLRAFESPGSTLSPHNLSECLTNALRAYFFGGFLSFPTWDKNKYNTTHSVVKGLYKTTRSDTGFKDSLEKLIIDKLEAESKSTA
jgi:hypothetical protein